MPRPLSEYGPGDWLRLRPLLHRWKEARYSRIDAAAMVLPHRYGDLPAIQSRIGGKDVLVTIAFNDPQGLSMHRALARRNVRHDLHLIVDNSSDPKASLLNRDIAAQSGAIYLVPPPNPWSGRNGSRSHGFAMNWAWRQVLLPARPRNFGFVDHDMHATQAVDPFRWPGPLPFHGDLRRVERRWFLWAGYCFYSFDAVAGTELDFGLDWFCGLDTGGANWDRLYRRHDPARVVANDIRPVAALPGVALADAYFEWRNGWLHEVGCAAAPSLVPLKRAALLDMLTPILQAEPRVTQAAAAGLTMPAGER